MKLQKLTIMFVLFRTRLQVWRNKVKLLLIQNPALVISALLMITVILLFSWQIFVKFSYQFSATATLMNGRQADRLVASYVSFVSFFVFASTLVNASKIRKGEMMEVILASPHSEFWIRLALLMPSVVLISFFAIAVSTPYSFVIFKLAVPSSFGVVYLFFVQIVYVFLAIFVAGLISRLICYTNYRFFNIKTHEALVSVNVLFSIIVIAAVALVGFSQKNAGFLPSGYIQLVILAIRANDASTILFNSFAVLAITIATLALYFIAEKLLAISNDEFNFSEVRDIPSFRNPRASLYIVIFIKKILRSSSDFISLLAMIVLLLMGAAAIQSYGLVSSYSLLYYQFYGYIVVLLFGIFVMGIGDFDILGALKTQNGNIRKYSIASTGLLIAGLALLYLASFLIVSAILHIRVETSSLWSLTYCPLYVVVAQTIKTMFISEKSEVFAKVASAYGYMMAVMLFSELGSKVADRTAGLAYFPPLVINMMTIVSLAVVVFVVQIFLSEQRYCHDI